MPRKLKTFVTSIGFFDQAIAAPSMKAALEAWGAGKNSFHHGFAEETGDPAIVKATMAKPGIVLKRAVGTEDAFTENPDLPSSLPKTAPKRTAEPKPVKKPPPRRNKEPAEVVSLAEKRAAKKAAAAFEREQAKRKREEKKGEAARERERERRDAVIRQAEEALERAEARHQAELHKFNEERARIDARAEQEEARWNKEKKKLYANLRRAKD